MEELGKEETKYSGWKREGKELFPRYRRRWKKNIREKNR
jgi:hypothetical protein